MSKKEIRTESAPRAIGPYSQGIRSGDVIFTSGQIAINPSTGTVVAGGIEEQASRALENLKAVLEAAGAGMSDIVKTTVFLKDMNDFSKFNDIYASFLTEPFPARSCVEVSRLPRDVLVEIEAMAVKK